MLTDADSNSGGVVVDGSRRLDPGRDVLPNKLSVSCFPPSCARILAREASASYRYKNETHSSFDRDLRPSGNDHPHTCAIHFAIGTSVFIILTIHRCSNISFGVGRVSGSWMRLKRNFRRLPVHDRSRNKGGRGSETYASLMKSFIALLHCTFSSSSSLGGWVCVKRMTLDDKAWDIIESKRQSVMRQQQQHPRQAGNHLRGRNVHHEFDGREIAGERESILNQL